MGWTRKEGWAATLNGMGQVSLARKVRSEQAYEASNGVSHAAALGKSVSGRGNSQCKGPKVGMCLAGLRHAVLNVKEMPAHRCQLPSNIFAVLLGKFFISLGNNCFVSAAKGEKNCLSTRPVIIDTAAQFYVKWQVTGLPPLLS